MKKVLDWNEYVDTARQMVAEGCVLLENKNETLPLKKGTCVSIFGRIQNHYYKSGTGSGGMVNVTKVVDIVEGLKESGVVTLNQELFDIYQKWEETHPFNEGIGWGQEPWSQEEMPLSDEVAKNASAKSDVALVIIGRTAGEDKDNSDTPGAYRLSDIEEDMLKTVRANFDTMIVLLNVGGVMDLRLIDEHHPEAVVFAWQGGMVGGLGTADVLTGKVTPSGKLTDTIAYEIADYEADKNFGDGEKNYYCDDIYVGYRYFETFAKDRVRYPFGYGLSYTTFEIKTEKVTCDVDKQIISVDVSVKNTGKYDGKEVVQVYVEAPQGKLGKPARNLVGFAKTELLAAGNSQTISLKIPFDTFASFDDSGVTGHRFCYLFEEGQYNIYVGNDVRKAALAGSFVLDKLIVQKQLEEALAPVEGFERIRPVRNDKGQYVIEKEAVPVAEIDMEQRRLERLPKEIPTTEDRGIKLSMVRDGKASMEEFVAQFTDEDLSCIVRGEGMGSSLVTAGTAAAFGGVSERLREFGLPAVCCDDGPSGMRLDCGAKAFSLPNGTMIACSFNLDLAEKLFGLLGLEMVSNHVECLLGPGINIHRHPLNGRNFEYFSEDPYLTGIMAVVQLKGLKSAGVSGTIKHFCSNNQEYKRRISDTVVSQRALREIYLKGYELAVLSGYADSIMTTYGRVNGLYTAGLYDLTTTILRGEWGFKGVAMTDWWAYINVRGEKDGNGTNFAAMARAQNDMYMVCPDGAHNAIGDNTLESLENGTLKRSELQRIAMNVCDFVMNTMAMKRLLKEDTKIEIINRPKDPGDFDINDVEFTILDGEACMSLEDQESKADTSYIFAFDIKQLGKYKITVTGSSDLGELAQMPCTFFFMGTPMATFTFHGTGGELMEIDRTLLCPQRFVVCRLFVARNGLKLKNIKFELVQSLEDIPDGEKKGFA